MNAFARGTVTILSLGLLILSPLNLANAASGKVEVVNLRGPLVNAWFTSFDASGCVEMDTFVTAQRDTYQQLPGHGATTGTGAVSIFVYDACTNTSLLQAVGQTDTLGPTQIQISNQLDTAAMHATITATNIDTGATFDVDVDMAWASTSDITRDHSNTNDRYPGGCHVLNRWKGSGRDAVASGSVSDGATNFTSGPSDLGEIGIVIDGFEVIGCP